MFLSSKNIYSIYTSTYVYIYIYTYLFIYIIAWSYAHYTIFIGHPIPQNSQPLLLLTMVLTLCGMIIPIPWSPRRGNPLKSIEILVKTMVSCGCLMLGGWDSYLLVPLHWRKSGKEEDLKKPTSIAGVGPVELERLPQVCLPTCFGWPVDFRKTCCEVSLSRKKTTPRTK